LGSSESPLYTNISLTATSSTSFYRNRSRTTDPSLAVDVIPEVAGGKSSPEASLVVTGGGAIVVMVGSATPPAIASTVTVKVDTPPVAPVTGSSSAVNGEPLASIMVVSATVKTLPLSWALTGAGGEELRVEAIADMVGSATPPAIVQYWL
jgi:hypothetical protein